jgi:hypothetical protein
MAKQARAAYAELRSGKKSCLGSSLFADRLRSQAIALTENRSRLPTKIKKCYGDITPTS